MMPCVYDDVPGSWGRQSEGWPQIQDANDEARKLVIANNLVPYGSYVTVGGYLRLETQEYVDIVRAAMRAAASPPSSAAEASINPPEIDSKLIPDAAEGAKLVAYTECTRDCDCVGECKAGLEQAKPVAINPVEIDTKLIDEFATAEALGRVADQAQAGEHEPFWSEKFVAGVKRLMRRDGLPELPENRYAGLFTADQMRDYANACRLAGGVTVDDAMVERALDAFDDACIAHNKTAPDPAMYEYRVSWFGYSREHRLVVMRAALVAAFVISAASLVRAETSIAHDGPHKGGD